MRHRPRPTCNDLLNQSRLMEKRISEINNGNGRIETRNEKEEVNNKKNEEREEGGHDDPPLMALNHVSRLCRNVKESIDFYTNVLGFVLIERPPALDFEGAWLFNYGVGIHLVQSKDENRLPDDTENLDPMDNHISFQCENMEAIEKRLKERKVKYMKRTMEDDKHGTAIDQLFFNDPDGFMVEICNCENLKLVPAGQRAKLKLPPDRHNPPIELADGGDDDHKAKTD